MEVCLQIKVGDDCNLLENVFNQNYYPRVDHLFQGQPLQNQQSRQKLMEET
jgi:hypothetical protein